MSVPTYRRHPQKFGVLTKALDLASFTAKLCGNEKNTEILGWQESK